MPSKIHDIFEKKKSNKQNKKNNDSLEDNENEQKIQIDYREKNSLVSSYLLKLGLKIEFKELKVGDYIVGGIAIERKTVFDFVSSMINGRLLKQLEELQQYEKKLLIIEGIEEQEIYNDNKEGVNGNAIRSFILSILLNYKVPIIFTKNPEDTAKFIFVLSKKKTKEKSINVKKKVLNKKEQMQFILEGFPGIGPKTAKKLLGKFGKLQNIFNAPQDELQKIIGKKAEVFMLIEENY